MLAASILLSTGLNAGLHQISDKVRDHESSVLIEVARDEKIFTCTGVLISRDIVLTAAHCVDKITSGRVFFDNAYNPMGQNFISLSSYVIHPGYNKLKSNYLNDLAVIVLNQDARNKKIASINWNESSYGESEFLRTGQGSRDGRNDRKYFLPRFDYISSDSKALVFKDQESKIGDSGGPIYSIHKNGLNLVGIHSTVEGSDKTYAVNIPRYKNWIQKFLD